MLPKKFVRWFYINSCCGITSGIVHTSLGKEKNLDGGLVFLMNVSFNKEPLDRYLSFSIS